MSKNVEEDPQNITDTPAEKPAYKPAVMPLPTSNEGGSQLTYAQKYNTRVSPYSPLARKKPLIPNTLDKIAMESANKDAAIRKKSGYKWAVVQEK